MAARPPTAPLRDDSVRVLDGGFRLVAVLGAVLVVAMAARLILGSGSSSGASGVSPTGSAVAAGHSTPATGSPGAPLDPTAFLYPAPAAAPPVELTDSTETAFSLASQRGHPVFVFFGYTHCPDVCPATVGTVGLAMDAFGPGATAVFVTVDPERDTPEWLREYVRFLPTGFAAVTGTPDRIRATADAWGVRYAKVESDDPTAYSMSHTADVYLVDGAGLLRAHFPFGTDAETMTAVLREVVASPQPSAANASAIASGVASPAAPTVGSMDVKVVSSSIWSGPAGPIILDLLVDGTRVDDPSLAATVQLLGADGATVGDPVPAIPVQPPGVETVSYVVTQPIPAAGAWQIEVSASVAGTARVGVAAITALDPGATAALGATAPTIRTPTLDDVGGNPRAVTTDPAPDLRLSRQSTVDALAAHQPFVLVIDSTKFRVSPACGRAIIMARYLLDRWPEVGFIHLEPYRYQVITDTPVLDGTLDAPTLTGPADAWGIGGAPWGPRSMPWVFVVDRDGTVRAKYQGVMGSADVDVIVALVAQGG